MDSPRRTRTLIAVAVGALAMSGCGGEVEKTRTATTAASISATKASVRITSPRDGASVPAKVEVTGVVTPADATVDVNGEAADVTNGRFTATVRLGKDDSQVQATAAAGGVTADSVLEIEREPTAAEERAAARRKAAKVRAAARRKAASAQRRAAAREAADEEQAAAASEGSFVMPDEVGKSLQEAQDDIQDASGNPFFISRSRDATGASRMQVLDRGWQVCGQNVVPGAAVGESDDVVFSVVRAYEDCP